MSPDELKAELAKPGRSQSALARHMGLDQSAVNRLVNGGRELKARELEQIRTYLAATEGGGPALPPSGLQERVQGRLDALGLTQITAAMRAGLPRDAIRNLFRGEHSSPRIDTLEGIARALETSVAYLIGETSSVTPTSPGGNSEAGFQPASRPSGSEGNGAAIPDHVTLTLTVSPRMAKRILAMLDEG